MLGQAIGNFAPHPSDKCNKCRSSLDVIGRSSGRHRGNVGSFVSSPEAQLNRLHQAKYAKVEKYPGRAYVNVFKRLISEIFRCFLETFHHLDAFLTQSLTQLEIGQQGRPRVARRQWRLGGSCAFSPLNVKFSFSPRLESFKCIQCR